MSSIYDYAKSYNQKIKAKGKKHYAKLLILTTILETLALSLIPDIVDGSMDNFWVEFIIMLVLFSAINAYRYTKFDTL